MSSQLMAWGEGGGWSACFDSMMRLEDSPAVCWEQRLNIRPYLRLSLLHRFIYLYLVLRLLLLLAPPWSQLTDGEQSRSTKRRLVCL